MSNVLANLSDEQVSILVEAIPAITLLISSADGDIDNEELEWGEKLAEIRSFKSKNNLEEFYQRVRAIFGDKLMAYKSVIDQGNIDRIAYLSGIIVRVNDVLSFMDQGSAYKVYKSYLSFAKEISESSGGIFGFLTVNREESLLQNLPMINPIQAPEV